MDTVYIIESNDYAPSSVITVFGTKEDAEQWIDDNGGPDNYVYTEHEIE